MKIKQILTFSVVPHPIKVNLEVLKFDPVVVFGTRWRFSSEINGPPDNDGIISFGEAIVKASTLSKEEGCKLLFTTGIEERATKIIGEDRIKVLADLLLADPDLLWSLYKEEGQKTLRYLFDVYGVTWMEAIRRVLLGPFGNRYSLCLIRKKNDGSWIYDFSRLDCDRFIAYPVLSFAV